VLRSSGDEKGTTLIFREKIFSLSTTTICHRKKKHTRKFPTKIPHRRKGTGPSRDQMKGEQNRKKKTERKKK
jgi:hypothetical protein